MSLEWNGSSIGVLNDTILEGCSSNQHELQPVWRLISIMELRELASDHLPSAVVAAIIFTIYDSYTSEVGDPLMIGIDFVLYVVVIFIGFVVITPILDRVSGSDTT